VPFPHEKGSSIGRMAWQIPLLFPLYQRGLGGFQSPLEDKKIEKQKAEIEKKIGKLSG